MDNGNAYTTPERPARTATAMSEHEKAAAAMLSLGARPDFGTPPTHRRKCMRYDVSGKSVCVAVDLDGCASADDFAERRNRAIFNKLAPGAPVVRAACSFADHDVYVPAPPNPHWVAHPRPSGKVYEWTLENVLRLERRVKTCGACRNCAHPHWRRSCLAKRVTYRLAPSSRATRDEAAHALRRISLGKGAARE